MKVDETLMDPHLKAIPGLGSFTAGGLPGGDAKGLKEEMAYLENSNTFKNLLLCLPSSRH